MRKSPMLAAGIPAVVGLIVLFQISCKKDEGPVAPPAPTPPAVSIGQLEVSPTGILVNSAAEVTIRLTVPADVVVIDSTVKVVRVNSSGQTTGQIGLLYDDGRLEHGDDIIGDKIYSTINTLTETAAGAVMLRADAVVKLQTGNVSGTSKTVTISVFSDFTSQEFIQVAATQDSSTTKLNTFLGGNKANLPTALDQLTAWLQSQSSVQSVDRQGNTSISILYKSGVYGGLIISEESPSGTVLTRGGVIPDQGRRKSKSIPLTKQTVGTSSGAPPAFAKRATLADLDPKVIGNRNVLIYAPFEAAFAPANERASVVSILNNSGYEFDITSLVNQDATIGALSDLTSYGFVLLATHGSQGKAFATGEIVDTTAAKYQDSYKAMLKAGKLAIWKNMVIRQNGAVQVKASVYAIRFPFISDLAGTFPNSVILNNSCESTMNPDLGNAFVGKGAKTYYGYNKVVNSGFCVTNADTVVKRLATDLKTTGQAFMAGSDPVAPNANFQLVGQNDVHYPDSLINGDFEFGKLDGWTKSGDGRVISQLVSQTPTGGKYMGIISTGLGFTTETGRIFQTFRIFPGQTTLTVKWNFLSEEFLEFINSSFQDYFQIVIKRQNGTEDILFGRTIDGIAAQFGATDSTAGNLIKVSPAIVFDRGDVYMTGWQTSTQTSTFNISTYAGQRVTLILRAGDVGDSIYDTAILLDDISVK